ncbi:hypothetical protein D9Q98_004263 [Chlorella vulgaris]|uniref:AAA+ ATPase domain-containing protein n=1 Tax=Chlorella vulgaris TaxID=3077 RepID=A0A9D4TS08_CHLVU|nr:hypothetical protein D9Q98_004263 [Chlorella vulgaris]
MDARHKYFADRLADTFDDVTPELAKQAVASFAGDLDEFLAAGGTSSITWFYQVPDSQAEDPNALPQLYVADVHSEPLTSKALCFTRGNVSTAVPPETLSQEVAASELAPQILENLEALLTHLYIPMMEAQQTHSVQGAQAREELLQGAAKLATTLSEAAAAADSQLALPLPEARLLAAAMGGSRGGTKSLTKAAANEELVAEFAAVLAGWCVSLEGALKEGREGGEGVGDVAAAKHGDDAGPESELSYWRRRMSHLTSLEEQLQSGEHRCVVAVCTAAEVPACARWRQLDLQLTEAAAEAAETVKYLGSLEDSLACLYTKAPAQITDSLPLIANNLRMVHSVSRHYSRPAVLASFLRKVANQLTKRCRQHLLSGGKLWEQNRLSLIAALHEACALHAAFAQHVKQLLGGTPSGTAGPAHGAAGTAELVAAACAKYGQFAKRCGKLAGMFGAVHQFGQLEQHTHIEGVSSVLPKFAELVDDFKRRQYDLLDSSRTQYDRDLLEFEVQVHDLEAALQEVLNASFSRAASTEQSLLLLRQYESLLLQYDSDSLRSDLDAKYAAAFQSYCLDLEAVQAQYEKHKAAPPRARNAPPVAGCILWARHLLCRVEAPMQRFRAHPALLASKESKKAIRTYNRLCQALLEYEALWHAAWLRSVDAAKAQLQATLLTQHPETGALLVNLDRGVLQLMREAQYMRRLGLAVPDSAQVVLLQQEKLGQYYGQLSHALKELARLTAAFQPAEQLGPLLAPHLEDLQDKVQPGLLVLTWTSMNVDGYLHRLAQGLARTGELARQVGDLMAHRIEGNLEAVASAQLMHLPADASLTREEFVAQQAQFVGRQVEALSVRNQEVQRACEELLDLAASWPRENGGEVRQGPGTANAFRDHCARSMYQALLSAVKSSFAALQRRLTWWGSADKSGTATPGGTNGNTISADSGSAGSAPIEAPTITSLQQYQQHALRPVFKVDLQLLGPTVVLQPSLDDIQDTISSTAQMVLAVSKQLRMWNCEEAGGTTSYHDLLCQDTDVAAAVKLLTASLEGMREAAAEHLRSYQPFHFLLGANLAAEYAAFAASQPSLEDCEGQLKRISAVEQEISLIPLTHHLGPLTLDCQPLKFALKTEAAAWKSHFSANIHAQAAADLQAYDQYLKELTGKLNRQVEDLEDVRAMMAVLREVSEYEAGLEAVVGPIDDVYALLMRHEVRVPKDEADLLGDTRYSWRKLKKLAGEVADRLATLQVSFKRTLLADVRALVADAVAFRADWEAAGPTVPGLDPMDASERLRKFQQLFEARKRKWEAYSSGEELFGLPVTQYPELYRTQEEIVMLDKLYSLYVSVITTIRGWGDFLWADVVEKIDAMGSQANEYQVQSKRLPIALRDWPAYKDCRRTIDDFLNLLPLFQSLTHKSIRPRHWEGLMAITGRQLVLADDVLKLQHLLDLSLLAHRDDVEELCASAVKEEQIEVKLAAVGAQWAAEAFTFAEHKQRGAVVLKPSDTSELLERLEDSLMVLGSMATNRYSAPFRGEVQGWISKLSTVSETLEGWLTVQSMWQYMEAVFSGGDIVKQLPQEAKRFANIDKNFIKVVAHASETLNVVDTCVSTELLRTMLPHLLEQLEQTQKSLSAYLETKRSEFPRFYFVSDPTLLEILSLGSDPPSVVPHFQSGLFDSLTNVTFDKADRTRILEMFSREGECVPLEAPVEAKGNIEVWLQRLVEGMQSTMKAIIKRAHRRVHEMQLEEFLFSHPAQVALLGLQFQWTADTQAALHAAKTDKGAVSRAAKKAEALLRQLVDITLRSDITRSQRTSLETCITVHIHQKEASEDLVRKKVRDPGDFEWLKQCRFGWREERDTVVISICDVDFEYSYEYLGVKERLVITPLTDVCYITLSQALGMFLGGAPAGPAGTGKTETTKDLGNTLGKYVVVFNCSDQMDYKGLGKIFKGLAQSGLWCCLDEFNRINLDVLSVCAQQIYCVLSAIRERKKSFVFTDGTTVPLDPRVGFFITMNPGYAGRQELPENLKALFRGVTMMVPNRQIIIKVKLAACGYQENEPLSKKFFVLYGLCEQQLSKQAHYDFGLRNILSVLRTAGASKRANPDKSEAVLMMRTLRDMNMSKFVAEDVPLFLALVDDLFPGTRAERSQYPEVMAALEKVVAERGLQPHPSWLQKAMELYETYLVRHGIMVVGPAGAGKTQLIECLAAALTELGTKHVTWRMNPKAITVPQMFGRLDAATGDWTDGIFSVLWRRAAKAKNQHTWIVLDGPVDAIWIENCNTVLDDNKVLTLANGDRIQMTPHMKALFEPENLANASPATVSRAGIIYVSGSELGWAPVVASWLAARSEREAAALRPCFDKYVAATLDYVRLELRPVMHNEPVCQVSTLLTLLSGVLKAGGTPGGTSSGVPQLAPDHYERLFLYCLTWSLGGLLDGRDRVLFDAHLRSLTDQAPEQVLERDTLYEFLVDERTGLWQHWRERIPPWQYPSGVERPRFAQLVIPTLDSVRYEHLLGLVHSAGKATLLVGGPGTAKTCTVQQFLGRLAGEEQCSKTINFSYLTTPGIFQTAMEGAVEKRQGRTFGPPSGKTLTVFIDDISMPAVNEWGDQVTNELVRQLLEQQGFYSLEKPIGDQKTIVDTRFVAAMGSPGAGRNDIPNRLKRQFAIFHVLPPSEAAINGVFGSLMAGRFDPKTFSPEVVSLASRLVPLTMELWGRVQARMLPTPAKFHYLFNLRDLSRVFQGIILAQRDRFASAPTTVVPLAGGTPRVAPPLQQQGYGGRVSSPEGYLLALWAHECQRVFADKLISLEDKGWVASTVAELAKQAFGPSLALQASEPLMFVDYLREPRRDEATGEVVEARPSCYESVPGGVDEVRRRVEEFMGRLNEASHTLRMELVLFKDALEHVVRLSRLLAMERGSALLVGVGGSGKQSLARLAAYIAGAYTFQITITKTYNVTNLLEDIRGLYKIAGVKGQPVCFIVTDSDIKEDSFLEYINQLLMTGEIAGLIPKDELDVFLNDVRPAMRQECPGVPDTYDNLYSFFINRVRDRLHVVLCFSPVGTKFSRWAQQFPGLIAGCTIDWYLPWPEEALTAVSSHLLDSFPMDCSQEVKGALKHMMASVHVQVTAACQEFFEKYRRQAHVTPKSYLSFINGYKALYSKKLTYSRDLAASINSGLQKMNEAKADIGRMKGELAIKNQSLAEASRQAEVLLKEISESTTVAEKEKGRVAVIVEGVRTKAEEIAVVKSDAEEDLASAKPALDAALAALNSITPKDITSLKALRNPPDVIKRIFDCVLLLRHLPVSKATWQDVKGAMVLAGAYEEAVKMMGDMNFLQSLVNFPKEAINDETVELLGPYFAAPDFNFEAAKKASGNVAGLCNWAKSMCKYHEVAKEVEPKIEKLRESEAELKLATRERQQAEEELAVVQGRLDEMQTQFDAAMAQKQALEQDAAATQARMDAANSLISALGGEEVRWTAQSRLFDDAISRLIGDCAIASSFVSYLGPFNKEFRELLSSRDFQGACLRLGIPVTKDLQVASFLADETEIGEWSVEGLPGDDLSVQNGILVTRATRSPLLVDPQGQGHAWLLKREAANGLRVTQLNDKHFRNVLEDCLASGRPLLIENVEEELDPVLDPVLERRYMRKGKSVLVQLADKEVDVADGFRLYCTTRLPNPRFTPELSAKVTVIDFTVTQAGLEDQLLGSLILKEKGELEAERQHLLAEVQQYSRTIRQLEDDLLYRLSNSRGNLLDDTGLVEILAVTKQTAQEVNERLQTASETRRKINEACEEYRGVARRATLLYFLIAEFAGVNCMYQTSLAQFNELYAAAIDGAERAVVPSKRVLNITDHLTHSIYLYVQRGLFERHKLIFALMLTTKILVSSGSVRPEEVDVLLKMGSALDIAAVRKKPKEWISDAVWLNVVALSALDTFRDLPDSLARGDAAWRAWHDCEAPEAAPVPDYDVRLTRFERMLLVRAFREDRTLLSATSYIAATLGQRFVEGTPLSMERVWAESRPKCPVICLLSPGADPTKLIEDLAKRKKVKTLGVSLGQGQEVVARRHVATAAAEGCWVLLQNAHLGLGYLAEVEQYLSKADQLHDSFRLWITAEPNPAFPIGLLQMGLKVTNEAPVGIKAGLRASYQWVTQDSLDAVNRFEWRQLLFTTCFLHSVVQERRKFGPIGWNVPYEFSQGDLAAVTQFLQNHVADMEAKRSPQPDWATVRYMIASIQYSGRITDDYDRLLMETYAERYYQPEALAKGAVLYRNDQSCTTYAVPDGTDVEVFRAAIEELPGQDSPELFGLHSNADLTFRRLQVQDGLQLILDTQPKSGGGGGGLAREEVVDGVCEELLGKMPPLFAAEATKERLKKLQPLAPLTIHLRQEIDRLNVVLQLVTSTLQDLRLAIAGTIALSDELLGALDALFNARVPPRWAKVSWEASGSGSWFAGLLAGHDQLARWLAGGRPKSYWMSGFFNPQGFLTAVKQEVARRNKWPLDAVLLSSGCTKYADESAVKAAPEDGVHVHGLFLDGAAWGGKENRLVEQERGALFAPLPVMHLTAVLAKDRRKAGVVDLPCYRGKRRTGQRYIDSLMLRSGDPASKWVLRGAAILCSVD